MAFESLSDRLQETLKKVTGQATLTEANMEEMLREIRLALLEADVNYQVVKEFIANTKEKAIAKAIDAKRAWFEAALEAGMEINIPGVPSKDI